MAKKTPATRPKNGILQSRPTDEQWEEILAYCHEHDLSVSEYVRLCHVRRGKRPPSKAELETVGRPVGNPAGWAQVNAARDKPADPAD